MAIADEHPHGSSVVVRRRRGDRLEYLLLHRNVNGADYEGDWAWTSPAGARQPGEAVYPAALRELAEEAGLTALAPWAVDLSARWGVFAVDVEPATTIDLVVPEHDRYEWLPPAECLRRVLPPSVAAAQISRTLTIPSMELSFRRMTHDDLPAVVRWQQAPHARRWFHDGITLEDARRRYGPRIDGAAPVRMWVVQMDGIDAGYLQDYIVGDQDDYAKIGDPDAVGFDYLIGDEALVGRRLGTRMVWAFLRDVVAPHYPAASRYLASPDHRNIASLRALAKCGFTQGMWIDAPSRAGAPPTTEIVCTLDRGHWFG
ncbi:MAG: GNAT family N-acetyltransferase [Actinomycetota bacterium]|nr:GNAT family N-acetyltransferase [Actinomycetota bacterium]